VPPCTGFTRARACFRKAETLVDYYQTAERFLREHVF
jgi:hypothetical protein